jgi:uncharacterized membrane protein YkvI
MSISIQFTGNSTSGNWLLPFLLIFGVIWLMVLAAVLQRKDFDAITRLTWVVVIIFVPFLGIILYWAIAPSSQWSPREKIDPSNQLSGTPWENNPAYTAKNKQS